MVPARWLAPFRFHGRIHGPLVAAFLGLNLLVAVNAVIHNSHVGYDADAHVDYLQTVATGTLPSRDQSEEFYAAPLSYAIPAALAVFGVDDGRRLAKAAQLANLAYSLLLTYFLIRLSRQVRRDDPRFATWSLLLLGMLPVYYRTVAFVRGETLCAALAVVAAEQLLAQRHRRDSILTLLAAGAVLGLSMLAKQWGVPIAGAAVLFLVLRNWSQRDSWRHTGAQVATVAWSAALVGGWFYAYLFVRFGSVTAFTEPLTPVSVVRPLAFFTGLGLDHLFTNPLREQFSEPLLFWPLLYSDTWGDYWGYWLADANGDGSRFAPYLARLNVMGLLPSALIAAGMVSGMLAAIALLRRRWDQEREGLALCALAVAVPFTAYVLLLLASTELDVKASYILHVFPFAAVLAAAYLSRLRERAPLVARGAEVLLMLALAHTLPALLSRFSILG